MPASEVKRLRAKILEVVDARLNDYADYLLEESARNLIDNKTSDTGFLAGSGQSFKTEFLKKTVSYSAEYAPHVEYGTRPHWVAPEYLVGWVERKLHKRGKQAWDVATAVSYKILNNGTEAQPFVMPAVEALVVKVGK